MTTAETKATDSGISLCVGGFDRNQTSYLNRELSWLAFNARVLQLARDVERPLLERFGFAGIFSSNLDEFFQVRVAGLHDQQAADFHGSSPDGRTPQEQLDLIRLVSSGLCAELEDLVIAGLIPALAQMGITIETWAGLEKESRDSLSELFVERILPVLTPLAVDPGHPFPYISDLSLNLAIVLRDPDSGKELFARLKVPPNLERFIRLTDDRLVPIEEVIAAHLPELFVGMEIIDHQVFRVIRNADLSLDEDEAEDLLSAVELELRRRRFGRAVRLEVQDGMSSKLRSLLLRELQLGEEDLYECRSLVGLNCLTELTDLSRPDLINRPLVGITEPELLDETGNIDVFAAMRRGDILLHHPYTSFGRSVVELLHAASTDPKVLAIKMTLYRVSGDSPVVASLIRAAEAGKQVAVLIELQARFDEESNINWARQLEQHGVHVTYGLMGLKTHAKCCMIIREEQQGIRRYCHVGSGNYNDRTARFYEDLGLMTADPKVGEDVARLFNSLTGYALENRYERLLVAPSFLRSGIKNLIENEMDSEDGRIVMKMNSLVDREMIDLLYEASQAGVKIELIVRGICCLRPGVLGLSENIRVRSLIGRYLEHSRIYRFGNGKGSNDPVCYIGSADLMERNLSGRVECLVKIDEDRLIGRLDEILEAALTDDRLAWDLDSEGVWTRQGGKANVDTHERLTSLAQVRVGKRN